MYCFISIVKRIRTCNPNGASLRVDVGSVRRTTIKPSYNFILLSLIYFILQTLLITMLIVYACYYSCFCVLVFIGPLLLHQFSKEVFRSPSHNSPPPPPPLVCHRRSYMIQEIFLHEAIVRVLAHTILKESKLKGERGLNFTSILVLPSHMKLT